MIRTGRGFAFAALLMAGAMVACSQPSAECPPAANRGGGSSGAEAPFGQIWVGTRINVDGIEQLDPQVTRPFFDVPSSYIVESWQVWPWASQARQTAYWTSEAEFENDVRTKGELLNGVQAVLYDPEAWPATPLNEQRDPAAAMERFAALGHKLGMKVVLTPGLTLPQAEGASCPRKEDESDQAAYLRCGIAKDAAAVADVIEVQSQTLQGNPDAYVAFLKSAAVQAREANPEVAVLGGLRVRDEESLDDVKRTWVASLGAIDGYYLAMTPSDADELLDWISTCASPGNP